MLQITKEFNAEIAHRLHLHKGACQFIHGHSYKFFITATSEELQNGMIIDFKMLKADIENVIGVWDHSLLLFEGDPLVPFVSALPGVKLYQLSFIPTAENMAVWLGEEMNKLRRGYKVIGMKVYETSTSCAEWRTE